MKKKLCIYNNCINQITKSAIIWIMFFVIFFRLPLITHGNLVFNITAQLSEGNSFREGLQECGVTEGGTWNVCWEPLMHLTIWQLDGSKPSRTYGNTPQSVCVHEYGNGNGPVSIRIFFCWNDDVNRAVFNLTAF